MQRTQRQRYRWVAGAGLLGLTASILAVGVVLWDFRKDTNALWDQVHIGDTEKSVRAILGAPFREYSRKSAPADYYVSGYRHQARAITERVLIYLGADMVFYVWIDRDGRVEGTFRGTS